MPIANGSEEMEAVMIIDILRRAKANVTVASVEDKLEIVASRKVKIVADTLLHDASKQQYDLIVLPVSFLVIIFNFNLLLCNIIYRNISPCPFLIRRVVSVVLKPLQIQRH